MNRKKYTKAIDLLLSSEVQVVAFFVIYLFTLAPDVYGFDSGELATGVFSMGIVHPPGFPLYMLIGKLFTLLPFGNIAFRLNLMSAFFGVLTVFGLYKLVFIYTEDKLSAWGAAGFFGASCYFWQMSVVAEVYTLHTFLMVCCLLTISRWRGSGNSNWLLVFSVVYGLSMCNHTSGFLFAPGYAWLVVSSSHWKWKSISLMLKMFFLFVVGLMPYAYIDIQSGAQIPLNYVRDYYQIDLTSIQGLWWMFSARAYRFFAFGYSFNEIGREFVRGMGYLWRNFDGVGAIFGLTGFVYLFRSKWKTALGFLLVFLGNFFFYINYRVLDKDTMFLPSFLIWAFAIGIGILTMGKILLFVTNALISQSIIRIFHSLFIIVIVMVAVGLNWKWVDMRKTGGPQAFGKAVLENTEPGSSVIASWSPAVVLEYMQIVENKRTDLTIVNQSRIEVARYYYYWDQGMPIQEIRFQLSREQNELLSDLYQNGPVYAVEYDPAINLYYKFIPNQSIYRLIARENP